jgi:hypothetical protein
VWTGRIHPCGLTHAQHFEALTGRFIGCACVTCAAMPQGDQEFWRRVIRHEQEEAAKLPLLMSRQTVVLKV